MLRASDAVRLAGSVQELYRHTDIDEVPRATVELLAQLVRCDAAAFNLIHADARVEIVHNAPWLEKDLAQRTWALEQHINEHPLENFYKRTGSAEPVRISDFLSRKKFHDLGLYQEFYRPLEVEYQISVFLQQFDAFRIGLGVQRHERDFSERDKAVIGCFAPHVFQAYKNAREFTRVRRNIRHIENGLVAHRQGLIHLKCNSRIDSISGMCQEWLVSYCPGYNPASSGLPAVVQDWLNNHGQTALPPRPQGPLVLQRGENKLIIRVAAHIDGSYDLLLQETNADFARERLACAGLTRREAEIELWLIAGKSTSEIAVIVDAKPATISKHLAHIFAKLGVENRTAAANAGVELIGAP